MDTDPHLPGWPAAARSRRPARKPAAESGGDARGRRARRARLLRVAAEHWPKIRSTNPLERFNREIARRTDVVGIFPDDASLIRLVSMVHRSQRRVGRRVQLHQPKVDGHSERPRTGEGNLSRSRQGGRAHGAPRRRALHRRAERRTPTPRPGTRLRRGCIAAPTVTDVPCLWRAGFQSTSTAKRGLPHGLE
jgi:hypothetical protein